MTVKKPKPKQLLPPITTGANSTMNQSQFLAITCNSLKAREKSSVHDAIGFGFASHWLKNWRDSFKPITKRSNHNHVITFDGHLKTALTMTTMMMTMMTTTKHLLTMIMVKGSYFRLELRHSLNLPDTLFQSLTVFYSFLSKMGGRIVFIVSKSSWE